MKFRVLVALGVAALAAGSLVLQAADASPFNPGSTLAQKKKRAKKGSGKLKSQLRLAPRGLEWGMGVTQISNLYKRYFDHQYNLMMKGTPLGPQTASLEAELTDKKKLAHRNHIKFGKEFTGVDSTPLKGEYSYLNNESMTKVAVNGGLMRYFFFFSDRLWKVYDEHKLRAGGPLGGSFEDAVATLTEMFGVTPKRLDPDFNRGRNFAEAHWSDGANLLRLVNREHEKLVGVVYVEESTQSKLPTLRVNKPRQERIDRDVTEATSKAPKVEPGKKKKKKGRR